MHINFVSGRCVFVVVYHKSGIFCMKYSCVKCSYKYIFMGTPQIYFNKNISQAILHAKKCKLSPIITPCNMHIHNSLSYVVIHILYINIQHTEHYVLEGIFMCACLQCITNSTDLSVLSCFFSKIKRHM